MSRLALPVPLSVSFSFDGGLDGSAGSRSGRSMGSEASPSKPHKKKSRSSKFAATLLDNLLNECERAQSCEEGDLEASMQDSAMVASYKSFAKGPKKFRLCVKRNPLYNDDGFRIMDRDAPYYQSSGKWNILNVATSRKQVEERAKTGALGGDSDARSGLDALFFADLYHAFLDAKLSKQLLIFFCIYMICFCVFALAFLWAADDCGLELKGSFCRAYMLSVETMVTIGYGVSDPYMQGCWEGPIIVTSQSLLQMLISASLIGVIFQGLSRPQSRASTILFSNKAVIRTVDGANYLMFRICDLRVQHALIEPHVRCYCVRMHPERGFEMVPMRLQQPDDDLGGSLVPTLPTMVVHRLDSWSPLAPPQTVGVRRGLGDSPRISPVRRPATTPKNPSPLKPPRVSNLSATSDEECTSTPRCNPFSGGRSRAANSRAAAIAHASWSRMQPACRRYMWPAVSQRQVDAETGNRTSCLCPYCGSEFATADLLLRHCSYSAASDIASGIPDGLRHHPLTDGFGGVGAAAAALSHAEPDRDDIKDYLSGGYFEIVVLVEGTEPTTASTLQARHSFLVGGSGEDLVWDHAFVECVSIRPNANGVRRLALDLGRFHELVERPNDSDL